MTQRNRYASGALVKRAVDAAKEAGLCITGLELLSDGTLRILTHETRSPAPNAYDLWKAQENAKKAKELDALKSAERAENLGAGANPRPCRMDGFAADTA